MSPLIALALAATAASGGAQAERSGVEVERAQARAEIVRPAIVRQGSGWQENCEGPTPQITRRGRTLLVEFQ